MLATRFENKYIALFPLLLQFTLHSRTTGTVGGANFPEILSIAGFKSTIDMAGDREMGVIFSSDRP